MKKPPVAYKKIWAMVEKIPQGKVATYGQMAAMAGYSKQPRMAGYALYNLPPKTKIPWQRVINAQGRISFPKGSAAYRRQRAKLKREGIVFIGGRVDLTRFRWQPLSESPLLD